MVSVTVGAYQHADYIRACLDGILMQKTDFPYEILIHDDASTDGTAQIIREYASKHPDLIFPIYQSENQFSKGVRGLLTFIFPQCRGKYIAICEGDDYWTDPLKLQQQVDFLEAHEEYAGCSHNTRIIYEDGGKDDAFTVTSTVKDSYTIDDITKGLIYFHTTSMLYRNIFKGKFPQQYLTDYMGDWFLLMAHADIGPIKYIDSVMSVYRIHSHGIWSKLSDIEQIERNLKAIIAFNNVFDHKYEENFLNLFTRIFLNLCKNENYTFHEDFFDNMGRGDLLKIIAYAYKDIEAKDSAISSLQDSLSSMTEGRNRIYWALCGEHGVVAKLGATWPVRRIARWIRGNGCFI